jgi:hypothetical protein
MIPSRAVFPPRTGHQTHIERFTAMLRPCKLDHVKVGDYTQEIHGHSDAQPVELRS